MSIITIGAKKRSPDCLHLSTFTRYPTNPLLFIVSTTGAYIDSLSARRGRLVQTNERATKEGIDRLVLVSSQQKGVGQCLPPNAEEKEDLAPVLVYVCIISACHCHCRHQANRFNCYYFLDKYQS
jgi:hypothetical protein